ncbi:MAG: glycosyltransferase [Phycisphaerales bacterium]|nr:glycosyltransferase [Phycisphaerales bacterium]
MSGGIHVLVTTHTTRHLRRTLMGIAAQRLAPRTVMVSCDNDLEEIADLVRECSREFERPFVIVQRPNMGDCRVGQARNNGIRALLEFCDDPEARVLYLDGDCVASPNVTMIHDQRGRRADLLIGFRIELTPGQTDEGFAEVRLRSGESPIEPTADQLDQLSARDAKYRRQLLLKRFGLTKAHKPKLLSAHFSVSLHSILRVNGFDEEFIGWGQEDDDFGRRLHASGARADIVIAGAVVFHQWHPTRAAGRWSDSAGVERFKRNLPFRCARGIDNPLDQPPLSLRVFENGREADRRVIRPHAPAERARA